MRNLNRNKQTFYYANYLGKVKATDSEGNYTGEEKVSYTKPCLYKAQVSSTIGQSQVEVFGTDIKYDKTILLTRSEFEKMGLTENSVLFVDHEVSYEEGNLLYDYEIKKIAPSPNEILIAIKRVR